MKQLLKRVPFVGQAARSVHRRWVYRTLRFTTSHDYWIQRYATGGNSGAGSYHRLAAFKAEVLNSFVASNEIGSVIEFGCGDGNQLQFAQYPHYTGFDISPTCIAKCRQLFAGDPTKSFLELSEYNGQTAELCLSLDVIYHLIEDDVFDDYMRRLFRSATRFVVIYSSNATETIAPPAPHVKHRKFSDWVDRNAPEWQLEEFIPNRYPLTAAALKRGDDETSFADFYIYRKV